MIVKDLIKIELIFMYTNKQAAFKSNLLLYC
jgi:hypothetical protein